MLVTWWQNKWRQMSAKKKWIIFKTILIETLDKSPYHPRPPWWPLCQTPRWDVLLCWPPWMRQMRVNVWRHWIHGSRIGIQRCNLQVSSLKTTSSTSKAITFCSILFSWDVLGYAFLSQGPTLSISRLFEDRIFFTNHSSLCRRYPPQGYHRQIHWKESQRNVNNNYFNFFEIEIKAYLSKGLLQFPQVKQALWYTLTIFMSLEWSKAKRCFPLLCFCI